MTPPTADHAWPPASPTQLASALLTSLQHVTSSARLFLTGCFQCHFLKAGCWRRQEEQDGAWFDCDKVQAEHPYCYVNPLAVSETNSAAAPSHPPLSQPASLAPEPRPQTPFKASHQSSPDSALAPRGLGTQYADTLPKRLKKSNVIGSLDSENGSFAAKLEADLRRIEYDRQRAEGEVLEAGRVADNGRSSQDGLDTMFFPGASSTFPYEIEESTCLQTDVWKSSELEDVFECYNMAAFYSYGATLPGAEKFSSKVRGEKFEEVFPVSYHNNNNNNNIKVFKPETNSENSLPLPVPDKDEKLIENVCGTFENTENRTFSEDELKKFICACIFAESVEGVDKNYFLKKSDNKKNYKDIINFSGRSLNKLLIFNLVKSAMFQCHVQYPRSLSLCTTYPVHLVQRKVITVILEEEKIEDNLCGLQMFHSPVLKMQQEKKFPRRLVENVAASEMKAENRQWQNFNNEEREMKETVFSEIFHDLINDTTDVFKGVVAKKLARSQEPEGNRRY